MRESMAENTFSNVRLGLSYDPCVNPEIGVSITVLMATVKNELRR